MAQGMGHRARRPWAPLPTATTTYCLLLTPHYSPRTPHYSLPTKCTPMYTQMYRHKANRDYPRLVDAAYNVAIGSRDKLSVLGSTYPTRDGSAQVRW